MFKLTIPNKRWKVYIVMIKVCGTFANLILLHSCEIHFKKPSLDH